MDSFFDLRNVPTINSAEYQFQIIFFWFRLILFDFNLGAISLISPFGSTCIIVTLVPEVHCRCECYGIFGPRLQRKLKRSYCNFGPQVIGGP